MTENQTNLDPLQIVDCPAQPAAVIHLTVPRSQLQAVMGPAIGEIFSTLSAQGIRPAGPVFSHHFKMDPTTFDLEVGVPVALPFTAAGRVKAGALPAATVVRTVYHGPYEGLGSAWGAFKSQIKTEGHDPAPNLWERYVVGPEAGPDSTTWSTELNQPIVR